MEIIELILFVIGIVALAIIAICSIYSNTTIRKQYELVIKNQNELVENNKTITNNVNLLKEHFNKNITDIAKTFDFYNRRIITIEERHYKRNKKINSNITPSNIDDVQ